MKKLTRKNAIEFAKSLTETSLIKYRFIRVDSNGKKVYCAVGLAYKEFTGKEPSLLTSDIVSELALSADLKRGFTPQDIRMRLYSLISVNDEVNEQQNIKVSEFWIKKIVPCLNNPQKSTMFRAMF